MNRSKVRKIWRSLDASHGAVEVDCMMEITCYCTVYCVLCTLCRVDLHAVMRWQIRTLTLCMLAKCCPRNEYQNLVKEKRFTSFPLWLTMSLSSLFTHADIMMSLRDIFWCILETGRISTKLGSGMGNGERMTRKMFDKIAPMAPEQRWNRNQVRIFDPWPDPTQPDPTRSVV